MDALTKPADQAAMVADYFDEIAPGYNARYSIANPFHNYFFRQRIARALEGLDLEGKTILDIGAGTGALYQEIVQRFPNADYFGCDIAPQMLAQSPIPPGRALVGSTDTIDLPRSAFDFMFSLGVTTYQTPDEMLTDLRFMAANLAAGGIAVVSFTNADSIDHAARRALKFVKPLVKRGVFGQPFATRAYRVSEVERICRQIGLSCDRVYFLNQTISPFSTVLPDASVSLARLIERLGCGLSFLSADFLAVISRKACRSS